MTTNKNDLAANLATCVNGLTANYPATESWVFNGTTYKRGDIINMLQACIQAALTTKSDHDAWRGSIEVERGLVAQLHPVLGALKKALEAEWGATSAKMAEFGFTPAKAPTKTAASKAASAAKAQATRSKKKAALGAVTAAPTAPAQPAAPPAPTAAAPAAGAPVLPKGA
jgi:hypothetical protein